MQVLWNIFPPVRCSAWSLRVRSRMLDPRDVKAKLNEVKIRYAWLAREQKRRQVVTPRNARMASLRAAEITRLFAERYGAELPDDDAGRADLELLLHHVAHLRNPGPRMLEAIGNWAPWLPIAQASMLAGRIVAHPHAWSADDLARRLNLAAIDRTRLRITTIGAVDMSKAERANRRRKLARIAKLKKRRSAGAKRRLVYEADAIERAKPWVAEGCSRRTWFRRRARGTGPATA